MLQYIDQRLNHDINRKLSNMEEICKFYKDLLAENYKVIDVSDTLLNDLFEKKQSSNLRVCGEDLKFKAKQSCMR